VNITTLFYALLSLLLITGCWNKKVLPGVGYEYLEEVRGEQAIDWVEKQNKETLKKLKKNKEFSVIEKRTLMLLNNKDKIPYGKRINGHVYNLWKDEKNPKGLLRRKITKDYIKNDGEWEPVLDIDQLSASEGVNWFYKGLGCNNDLKSQCLIYLSKDGTDARAVREFDLKAKDFVKGGFSFPVSKSRFSFRSKDELYVSDGFSAPNQTASGYPRTVKIVRRGQKVEAGLVLYQGEKSDVSVGAYLIDDPVTGMTYPIVYRAINFYENEQRLINSDGKLEKMIIPTHTSISSIYGGNLFLSLDKDWKVGKKTFKAGSLVTFPLDEAFEKNGPDDVSIVFAPTDKMALQRVYTSKEKIYLMVTNDVNRELYHTRMHLGNVWKKHRIKLPEEMGFFYLSDVSTDETDFFLNFQSMLRPPSHYFVDSKNKMTKMYSQKLYFKTSNLVVKQHFATSKDKTRVPYYIVHSRDIKLDGNNPTLVYAYGGFQISLAPYHSSTTGMFWLERGGVYVIANIRGGGEYGPSWHQAALKTKRQNAYDDFYAVAKDLIKRKITKPAKLAIKGGSNGGLLTAVAFTQKPDLYRAVISAVPLTDMLRFDKLLAGASWVAEYGSPSIDDEAAFLKKISPFHQVKKKNGYAPSILLKTSTSDDRVHPAHARKMAKKAIQMGHDVYYYENTDGGHGGGDNYKQDALSKAVEFSFLYNALEMK
jgi:prolyl oligopeptidase